MSAKVLLHHLAHGGHHQRADDRTQRLVQQPIGLRFEMHGQHARLYTIGLNGQLRGVVAAAVMGLGGVGTTRLDGRHRHLLSGGLAEHHPGLAPPGSDIECRAGIQPFHLLDPRDELVGVLYVVINSHTVAAGAAICWLISIGPGMTCSPATHAVTRPYCPTSAHRNPQDPLRLLMIMVVPGCS